MNKKFFGIKLSTILTFVICLVVSFVIWMLVKYQLDSKNAEAVFSSFSALVKHWG
jgi:hypothetical protein